MPWREKREGVELPSRNFRIACGGNWWARGRLRIAYVFGVVCLAAKPDYAFRPLRDVLATFSKSQPSVSHRCISQRSTACIPNCGIKAIAIPAPSIFIPRPLPATRHTILKIGGVPLSIIRVVHSWTGVFGSENICRVCINSRSRGLVVDPTYRMASVSGQCRTYTTLPPALRSCVSMPSIMR